MRELAEQNDREECQRGDAGCRPDQPGRPFAIHGVQMSGQRHREQRRNQEPAEMRTDFDTEDGAELDVATASPESIQGGFAR